MILFPLLFRRDPDDTFITSIILTATLPKKPTKPCAFVSSKRELEFITSESLSALELCILQYVSAKMFEGFKSVLPV